MEFVINVFSYAQNALVLVSMSLNYVGIIITFLKANAFKNVQNSNFFMNFSNFSQRFQFVEGKCLECSINCLKCDSGSC